MREPAWQTQTCFLISQETLTAINLPVIYRCEFGLSLKNLHSTQDVDRLGFSAVSDFLKVKDGAHQVNVEAKLFEPAITKQFNVG